MDDDDGGEENGENSEAYCRVVMVVTRSYLTICRRNYVHKVLFEQTRSSLILIHRKKKKKSRNI